MPDAHKTNGETQANAKTHIEVKVVGKNRINSPHARMPAPEYTVLVENGVGSYRDNQPHQTTHHRPKWQDHANKYEPKIKLQTCGHRR